MKVLMIDPPSGWKYGFPKAIPGAFKTTEDQLKWLVANGYPQAEIDRMGEYFYCRYWEKESES